MTDAYNEIQKFKIAFIEHKYYKYCKKIKIKINYMTTTLIFWHLNVSDSFSNVRLKYFSPHVLIHQANIVSLISLEK